MPKAATKSRIKTKKGHVKTRTLPYFLTAVLLLALTGLMIGLAKLFPEWVFSFYPAVSRGMMQLLAMGNAWAPFSVCELLAFLALFWGVLTLLRAVLRRHGVLQWLAGAVLFASFLLFSFTGLWGLNHFGPTVAEKLGMEVREYSTEELEQTASYMLEQANALALKVNRNSDGVAEFESFYTLARQAADGYAALSETYPVFSAGQVRAKRVTCWYPMSKSGVTGIILAWTGECCVNPDIPDTAQPFTMCHELAHRQSIAAEDGANFCAFLACEANDSVEFQYSGYFNAFIYCYNSVNKVDADARKALWDGMNDEMKADLTYSNAHYQKYKGKVQNAAQKVNDTYLKAFNESSGVQSYGEVTDLLIAWYLNSKA